MGLIGYLAFQAATTKRGGLPNLQAPAPPRGFVPGFGYTDTALEIQRWRVLRVPGAVPDASVKPSLLELGSGGKIVADAKDTGAGEDCGGEDRATRRF